MAIRNITGYNFTRSIGVNSNASNHQALYSSTGIRRFRMSIANNAPGIVTAGSSGNIPGYGVCVFVNGYSNLEAPIWSSGGQQSQLNQAASYIDFLEGPNEINNPGVGGGSYDPTLSGSSAVNPFTQSFYVHWAQQVYSFLQGSSSFPAGSGISGKKPLIVAGSLAGGQSISDPWSLVGNAATSYLDAAPVHNYPMQAPFNDAFGGELYGNMQQGLQLAPGKPAIATEVGHNTCLGNAADGISETNHAKLLLTSWCDLAAYNGGNSCMFIYNWQDDNPYSDQVASDQPYYGIFRSNGTTKVAARAIKNILSLINDTSSTYVPSSYPGFTISGVNNAPNHGTSQICVAKSDGSYWLVLWNEPKLLNTGGSYGAQTGADITPADNFINVSFNGASFSWTIYDPLQPLVYFNGTDLTQNTLNNVATTGTTPVASGSGTSIPANTLNLRGYPMLVKLAAQAATVVPGSVTVSAGTTTATSQVLNWTAAANQPADYIINVLEIT